MGCFMFHVPYLLYIGGIRICAVLAVVIFLYYAYCCITKQS
jgi:hypothetical protein